MQGKIGNGVFVTGRAMKDAILRRVGEKDTAVASWGMIVDKRGDDAVFVDCKAWYELGEYSGQIRKGDSVLAVGRIEEREHNGKTYRDLVCDFVSVSSAHGGNYNTTGGNSLYSGGYGGATGGRFVEGPDDGDDLPFSRGYASR